MKYLTKTALIAAFLFITIESYSQQVEFSSYNTWEEIVSAAKVEKKSIFVDVYTDWCGVCKKMDKEAWNSEAVATFYNKNFINVKLNAEDKGIGEEFAKAHSINLYPTLMYFNQKGEWVHRKAGYAGLEMMVDAGWEATTENKQLATQQKKFEKGTQSVGFLATYVDALSAAGLDNADAVEHYASQLSDMDFTLKSHWEVISNNLHNVDSKNFKRITTMKRGLEKMHTTASVNQFFIDAYSHKASSIAKDKNSDALSNFKLQLQQEVPDLADHLSAYADYKFHKDDAQKAHYYAKLYLTVHSNNANELNGAAWNYFENIDDAEALNDALFWSIKACRIEPNWYNTDTQANLLFKLGKVEEARKMAEKSIAVGIEDGYDPKETIELLDKINTSLKN